MTRYTVYLMIGTLEMDNILHINADKVVETDDRIVFYTKDAGSGNLTTVASFPKHSTGYKTE